MNLRKHYLFLFFKHSHHVILLFIYNHKYFNIFLDFNNIVGEQLKINIPIESISLEEILKKTNYKQLENNKDMDVIDIERCFNVGMKTACKHMQNIINYKIKINSEHNKIVCNDESKQSNTNVTHKKPLIIKRKLNFLENNKNISENMIQSHIESSSKGIFLQRSITHKKNTRIKSLCFRSRIKPSVNLDILYKSKKLNECIIKKLYNINDNTETFNLTQENNTNNNNNKLDKLISEINKKSKEKLIQLKECSVSLEKIRK